MKLNKMKYATGIWVLRECSDRFLSPYSQPIALKDRYDAAASIPDIKGVDMYQGADINPDNLNEVADYLTKYNLEPVCVTAGIASICECSKGGLSNPDAKVRDIALKNYKIAIDMAKKINCKTVNFWLGQDGYDYPLQMDHLKALNNIITLIRELADYNPKVNIGIEYKIREPRNYCYISSLAKTLLIIEKIDRSNVGVIMDTGHAMMAGENIGESIAMIKAFNAKLAGVHMNDNNGYWDDDLMVGSVRTLNVVEFLYWLEKIDYKGYLTLDMSPYRENGTKAAAETIEWIKKLRSIVGHFEEDEIENLFNKNDGVSSMKYLRKKIFKD
ncbi:MAG: sugar phosphate isomerase/epimerase [Actinobacteria bacterium]|nr:sugar phosphate isomerase/epimerase [Actinomycetota bacterium]